MNLTKTHFFVRITFCLSLVLASFPSHTVAKPGGPAANRVISSEPSIEWTTAESNQRFSRAEKTDFYKLANQFEPQFNKFYCGPTAAVIVLNALRSTKKIAKPLDLKLFRGDLSKGYLPKGYVPVFERYTQDAFFNENSEKVKTQEQVFGQPMGADKKADFGLQLRQLAKMLETFDLSVSIHVVTEEASSATIKKEIIENLKTPNDYVVVNYSRDVLANTLKDGVQQTGKGHISPLAAYDSQTDSVLVLDVNPSHQAWSWTKLDDLIRAMRTMDTVENRGYLLISDKL